MKENWVDFKAVKAAVSMEMVLARYEVNWLQKKGDDLHGRCPIHQGEGERAFSVSMSKNAFHCFSCKARGNVLDFVAAMEKCSMRDAGLKLQEWFAIGAGGPVAKPTENKSASKESEVGESAAANAPLSFRLKDVNHEHAYLAERGISKETAEIFGVGFYAGRGSMKGRVVIPIHNEWGELVAYAGRSVDGSEPRYKLPPGFHKSHVLFNLNRVSGDEVVVVEGFFDCINVWQSGHQSVVALMGSSLSEAQEQLLLSRFKRVTLLLDGDKPGRKAAEEIAGRLMRKLHVRVISLPEGKQPDGLGNDELKDLLQ